MSVDIIPSFTLLPFFVVRLGTLRSDEKQD